MEEILGTIGDAIGAVFGNPVVQLGFQVALAYLVLLWLAAAYWAFRDMQLRTENPIAPYFAAAAIIVSLPLFPLAVFATGSSGRRADREICGGTSPRRCSPDRGDPALPVL
jgi:hypothetical protein